MDYNQKQSLINKVEQRCMKRIEEAKYDLLKGLMDLRNEISFQYYEISIPMETTLILKKLDKIIKKIKYK